jgi:hypothetical protein
MNDKLTAGRKVRLKMNWDDIQSLENFEKIIHLGISAAIEATLCDGKFWSVTNTIVDR